MTWYRRVTMKALILLGLILGFTAFATTGDAATPSARAQAIGDLIANIGDGKLRLQEYRYQVASQILNAELAPLHRAIYEEHRQHGKAIRRDAFISAGFWAGATIAVGVHANLPPAHQSCAQQVRAATTRVHRIALTSAGLFATGGILYGGNMLYRMMTDHYERTYLVTERSARLASEIQSAVSKIARFLDWDLSQSDNVMKAEDALRQLEIAIEREVFHQIVTLKRPYPHYDLLLLLKKINLLTFFEEMSFARTRVWIEGAKNISDALGITEKEAPKKKKFLAAIAQFSEFLRAGQEKCQNLSSQAQQSIAAELAALEELKTAIEAQNFKINDK